LPRARVVMVQDAEATEAFQPNAERISVLVNRGLTNLTRQATVAAAWRSLVSTQDVIGLKVFSAPGANSGTRPAVVAAVVEGLLQAGVPAQRIIIWDKHWADLRQAGFVDLARRYGARVESSQFAGYDSTNFYVAPIVGQLVWGDLEFQKTGEGIGRKSFLSKLVSREITKIINITPLLNHNSAGVSGNLYSLAFGSVDNTLRFETDAARLAEAVPEIWRALALDERVALNIVDALVCQYQGEQRSLLHYSAILNEIRFSTDPVALDVLSVLELNRQRQAARIPSPTNSMALFENAALMELGVSEPAAITVERIP
ncbi:MAG TPA: DUF362 domain-containing protein, partial [Verrucomicrobiae bacterium]